MVAPRPDPDGAAFIRRRLLFAAALRSSMLALAVVVVLLDTAPERAWLWVLGLALFALVDVTLPVASRREQLLLVVEVAFWVIAIRNTGSADSPVLPYVLAPAFVAGLTYGYRGAVLISGWAAAMLLIGRLGLPEGESLRAYSAASAQWSVLALALGFVAGWIRNTALEQPTPQERYAEAHRLLSELRAVARRLPGGLDPVQTAEAMLDRCAAITAFDRGAVFVRTEGDHLVPLALRGLERLEGDTEIEGRGPLAAAWRTRQPVRELTPVSLLSDQRGAAVVLAVPVISEDRPLGLIALESNDAAALPAAHVPAIDEALTDDALRLDTALLFDEVRAIATVEERQRLAREIHDGIAQELGYVGYELDNLAVDIGAGRAGTAESVRALREQLTRIISELRLSIFDLRSTVDSSTSLGTALGDYVRAVTPTAGLTVHLSLSEGATRLPADLEVELLRIAQEAIGNARRHAGASNLWVTLIVNPPQVTLRVEDDGTGLVRRSREGGYGLEIMRERAARIRAQLTITGRVPTGTRVDLELGKS